MKHPVTDGGQVQLKHTASYSPAAPPHLHDRLPGNSQSPEEGQEEG